MNSKSQSQIRAESICKELAQLKAEDDALREKRTRISTVRLTHITNDGHSYGTVGEYYKPIDKNVLKVVTCHKNGMMFIMIDGEENVIDLDLYNELVEKLRPDSELTHLNELIDFCKFHDVYLMKWQDTIEDMESVIRDMPFLSSKKFSRKDINLLKKINHPWIIKNKR